MVNIYYLSEQLCRPGANILQTFNKKARHSALIFCSPGGAPLLFELVRTGDGFGQNTFEIKPATSKTGTDQFGKFDGKRTVAKIGTLEKNIDAVLEGVKSWASHWTKEHPNYKPLSDNCRCLVDSMITYLWGAFDLKPVNELTYLGKNLWKKPIDSIEKSIQERKLHTLVGEKTYSPTQAHPAQSQQAVEEESGSCTIM